jgi:hypothetical protein
MSTTVASCGVYPANHADWLPVVVPVLPAAGRPFASGLPAAVPCGLVNTVCSAEVRSASTSLLIARERRSGSE